MWSSGPTGCVRRSGGWRSTTGPRPRSASTARRIRLLAADAAGLRAELERLVATVAPWLLALPGVGPISAAQVLVSWSYAGRLRSEAAFAALAGVNPIPASSGRLPATG